MDDDDDEEHTNEFIPLTPRRSYSHRLAIRRTRLRTSPYHTTSNNIRHREHSSLVSRTINNLISNIEEQNIENNHVLTNVTTSTDNENHLRPIEEQSLRSSDGEDLQFIVDLSQIPHTDLSTNLGEFSLCHDFHLYSTYQDHANGSFHSVSPIDDEHFYYYPSTTMEAIIPPSNLVNLLEYPDDHEYSPSMNNNHDDDDEEEDLSIEIILESSQTNSLPPISRRRRVTLSSNQTGLRLADIWNIPQKTYSSYLQQFNEKSNTQCVICLEDFQLNDSIKILHCQHVFHT